MKIFPVVKNILCKNCNENYIENCLNHNIFQLITNVVEKKDVQILNKTKWEQTQIHYFIILFYIIAMNLRLCNVSCVIFTLKTKESNL